MPAGCSQSMLTNTFVARVVNAHVNRQRAKSFEAHTYVCVCDKHARCKHTSPSPKPGLRKALNESWFYVFCEPPRLRARDTAEVGALKALCTGLSPRGLCGGSTLWSWFGRSA